jgi:signal transduction histidine kinase/DNA-binding NarL/FixJ family response regulator
VVRGDRIAAGILAGVLVVALMPAVLGQPEPRLVRVATDPTQHRLLVADGRAARDANLISGYAQLVSEQTGMRFQEQPVESTTAALEAICNGRADLMLLLGPLDNAPCTALAASPAYYRGQTLLASRHIHAQPPEFAHLRRVAVIKGSRLSEWLAAYHPHLQVVGLPTLREALTAVEAGVVDVAMELDVAMRPAVRREFGDSLLLHGGPASLPGSLHLVVRHRDRPMLDQIHQAMRSISPQEHAMLMQRWTKATYLSGPSLQVMSRHFQWELVTMGLTLSLLLGAGGWMYRARQSARRSERQQARFLATMSHEVRNAAQALVTSVDLLHQSALDHGQRQLVNAARSAGVSLRHLLGHALDYERVASGEHLPIPGWQDLRQLARECMSVARPAADTKGLSMVLLQHTEPLPRIWIDGDALRQVLSNLLGNAVKFTDVGEVEVTLSLQQRDDTAQLLLAVRDTGIGIPANQHEAVFKPFSQAHARHSRELGGAGLGLSICRDLVRGMGGQLHLHSVPGEGSCFEVRLPAVIEGGGQDMSAQPLAGRTLLLVEDHALNRTVVARQLEVLGASVTACGDGASALRIQATEPCSIVLLDCVLDDMSGYELAVQLRDLERCHARIPAVLVAISANDSAGHEERCRSCGMDAVLCKPLEVRRLLDVLQLGDAGTADERDAKAIPCTESVWNGYLQSLQDELMGLNDALRQQAVNRFRHHAHRLSGVLRVLGQSALAAIADDLHELELDDATGWVEAERLLGYLRPAVAELVRAALTSTAVDSAATARAPGTP